MSARLAIGVGCRKGCPPEPIVALVREALGRFGSKEFAGLFTLADKAEEPGLKAAAALLGLGLVGLPAAALAGAMDGIATRSAAAEARFGLASVSEAAALAGAGAGARLLLPRRAAGGATCAVAAGPECEP